MECHLPQSVRRRVWCRCRQRRDGIRTLPLHFLCDSGDGCASKSRIDADCSLPTFAVSCRPNTSFALRGSFSGHTVLRTGATYVCHMQDESVIPPSLAKALDRVRQGADVMPTAQLYRQLEKSLGVEWRSRLKSFDETPIAAASIGQVNPPVETTPWCMTIETFGTIEVARQTAVCLDMFFRPNGVSAGLCARREKAATARRWSNVVKAGVRIFRSDCTLYMLCVVLWRVACDRCTERSCWMEQRWP